MGRQTYRTQRRRNCACKWESPWNAQWNSALYGRSEKRVGHCLAATFICKKFRQGKNIVYVADKSDLFNKEAIISEVNWVSIEEPKQEIEVEAQIRYRSHPVKGTLIPLKNKDNPTKTFKLIFEDSQSSVTPGQAAVFYKGEILLGGGLINFPQDI